MPTRFSIEPTSEKDNERCPCCGGVTRSVWGLARRDDVPWAAYFVRWTVGQVARHGASIDFIVGAWGQDTTVSDRFKIGLEYRLTETGPWVRVRESDELTTTDSELAGRVLGRSDVVGKPLADDVFALFDEIFLHDDRVAEIRGSTSKLN